MNIYYTVFCDEFSDRTNTIILCLQNPALQKLIALWSDSDVNKNMSPTLLHWNIQIFLFVVYGLAASFPCTVECDMKKTEKLKTLQYICNLVCSVLWSNNFDCNMLSEEFIGKPETNNTADIFIVIVLPISVYWKQSLISSSFLLSPFLACCAILPTPFGENRPHLRQWLVS